MANVLLGIHCVVPGCTSTLRKVNQWKARPCPKPKHKGKTQSQCMCPEPYQFFKFPTEIKLQKLWLERINRPGMEITNITRVCSMHFVEGKPTRRNYFPNTNLVSSSQQGEEADNEEDIEEPVRKLPRRRGNEASVGHQEGDEDMYESDLTISRFSYQKRGAEDAVVSRIYETVATPTNTVTITRVTATKSSSGNGPSNIRTSGPQNDKRNKTSTPVSSFQPHVQRVTRSGPVRGGSLNNHENPQPKRHIEIQEEADYEYPYEIDMVDDDDDCSGLSDMANETLPSSQQTKEASTLGKPVTVVAFPAHSQSQTTESKKNFRQIPISKGNTTEAPPLPRTIVVRPKLIPVLAVAPKTQQGQVIQPLTTLSRQPIQQIRKAVPVQLKPPPVVATTPVSIQSNATISTAGNGTNSTTTPALTSSCAPGTTVQTSSSQAAPLATYDPSKQQLQISNPVKYIQECHTRISDLVAENEKLKARNSQLEVELRDLQKSNNDLKREIANRTVRNVPQTTPASITLVPTRNEHSVIENATDTSASKPRIRYIIRRPI